MSTDIIHFYPDPTTGASIKTFSLGALQLYIAIMIPMMVATFATWYGFYWWVDRKQEAHVRRLRERIEAEAGEKAGL
jgi:H+/gluconate symporter-like permease